MKANEKEYIYDKEREKKEWKRDRETAGEMMDGETSNIHLPVRLLSLSTLLLLLLLLFFYLVFFSQYSFFPHLFPLVLLFSFTLSSVCITSVGCCCCRPWNRTLAAGREFGRSQTERERQRTRARGKKKAQQLDSMWSAQHVISGMSDFHKSSS